MAVRPACRNNIDGPALAFFCADGVSACQEGPNDINEFLASCPVLGMRADIYVSNGRGIDAFARHFVEQINQAFCQIESGRFRCKVGLQFRADAG